MVCLYATAAAYVRMYFWQTLHKSQIPSTKLFCYEYIIDYTYIPIFFVFHVLIYNIYGCAIDETRKEIGI